jgi:hypothetical protein
MNLLRHSGAPRPGGKIPAAGDDTQGLAVGGASLVAAEVVKYAIFNLALAIITPLVALIPIRLQEAAGGPTPPVQSLIGLPDLLVSCAILAWGALRDAMDADHVTKPIQQIFVSLGLALGIANLVLAGFARSITLANLGSTSNIMFDISMSTIIGSVAISAAISIGRGVRHG